MPQIQSRFPGILTDRHLFIRLVLALLVAGGALIIGEKIYFGEYLTTDENSYMFQAWLFLQGKLSQSCPPPGRCFFSSHDHLRRPGGVGIALPPPAHSIWLIPGVALGYPRLMSAVAAFLAVWFLTSAAERLRISIWISGAMLIISPYFWLMWGSVLSHTSGLAATAIMLWAYLVWIQDRKQAYAALAGLAWAFLFLNRSYTALWIALPFAIDALSRLAWMRDRRQLGGTLLFATCAVLGIGLYLAHNHMLTGNALLPPFLHYNPTEGPGFHSVNGKEHTLAIGWEFLKYNLSKLNTNLWGFSGSLLVWLALSVYGWRKDLSPLLLSATFLVWIGYTAFWFRGILELPPIYYYETLAFMLLSAGLGLQRLCSLQWWAPRWRRVLATALLAVMILPAAVHTFRENARIISKRTHYTHQFQQVIRGVPPGSIVVLRGLHKDILAQNSWNPRGLQSDPLIVRDVHGVIPLIPRLYPGRSLYLVSGWTPSPAQELPVESSINRDIPALQTNARTGSNHPSTDPPLRTAEAPADRKGKLGFGTKQYLLPGHYTIQYRVRASGGPAEIPGRVDILDRKRKRVLASRKVLPGQKTITLTIQVDEITLVEPRVFFNGEGKLEFESIRIEETGNTQELTR